MRGRRQPPEHVVRKLREADRLLGEGQGVTQLANALR